MRFRIDKLGDKGNDYRTEFYDFIETLPNPRSLKNTTELTNKQMKCRSFSNFSTRWVHARVCMNCGAEIYGEWNHPNFYITMRNSNDGYIDYDETSFYNKSYYNKLKAWLDEHNGAIHAEMDQFNNTITCPLCNAKLKKVDTYSAKSENVSDYRSINEFFKEINEKIEDFYRIESINKISLLDVKLNTCNSCKKQLSKDTLKEYVLNLINLESDIMCLSQHLEQLYVQKAHNDKDVVFQHNYALYDLRQDIDSKKSVIKNSKIELSDFEKQPISFKKKEYPSKPEYPILRVARFFNKKKVEAENAQRLHNYENALEKYNCDVKKCDADNKKNKINAETQKANQIKQMSDKIGKYTSELIALQDKLNSKLDNKNSIPTKALGEKHLLDSEIKTAEETLKELFKCRNELYSYNIVFEKYRNIVALSTFYEYLMAGRCETLDGVNGAYNIYENELRLNTIITKLDEIKENQFIIYNKLRDIDNSLSTLNNTMQKAVSSLDTISKNTSNMNVYLDNISKNTAVIAHNSAVTAYYSKVNAELTNALGFMVALT